MDPRISEIEDEYKRRLPAFAPGDTVRVRIRVVEGDKERIQPFEGICIARRGGGLSETFTLRRISGGVGVERIFPIHSPAIAGLEVVRRGDVRRAKLYYLRGRRGKRARVRERRWWLDAAARNREAGPSAEESPDAAAETPETAEPAAPAGTEGADGAEASAAEGPAAETAGDSEAARRRAAAEAAAE